MSTEDSDTVVGQSQTAEVMAYTSIGYASTCFKDATVNAIADTHTFPSVNSGSEAMESSDVGFDYSVKGSTVTEAQKCTSVINGTDLEIMGAASDDHRIMDNPVPPTVPPLSAEEERLWNIVRANSLDFNTWIALIEETEKSAEDNLPKIRKVYDAFLAEFPLCYGYWKKYADHEARFGSVEKVVEVYERAVQGVTYSVDIWLHYCIFAINTFGDPENVRRLFERGLAYVGSDFLSFPLWDKYIEYEYMQQEWGRLATIYTQILENPNQQLDRYFSSFKELAASRPLSDLRTAKEAAAMADALTDAKEQVNGVEVLPGGYEEPSKPVSAGSSEAEEFEKYIAIREEMFSKAKEFESKIIGFETAIRRPYFHVRPLNVVELENWNNYLDFLEQEGDFSKIVKLYERCLIACANYPEYWIRYILCMEASGSMDLANNALGRSTQVFVKRQPEIHLFAARFKEQNGDISGARASYELIHTEVSPGLLEAIVRHANMEQRLGKLVDAFSVYEQAIAIEKGKEHSQLLPLLYVQYSRFLLLACKNVEKAKEIMDDAVNHIKLSKPFIEALIHFESIWSSPKRIDYIESLVLKFIVPNQENVNLGSAAEREELSCMYLEFLNLFGDVVSIKKAEDQHARFFIPHRSYSELKKRHAEDFLVSDKAKMSKSYTSVTSSPQSLMGAHPSGHSQWATNYGVQQQGWLPVAQAQGQQWSASYTQPAYNGYGSGYADLQVPTSIPQSAAYASYPPTYSGQGFPMQGYAQATAPAALTTSQAPPQAYYGSY